MRNEEFMVISILKKKIEERWPDYGGSATTLSKAPMALWDSPGGSGQQVSSRKVGPTAMGHVAPSLNVGHSQTGPPRRLSQTGPTWGSPGQTRPMDQLRGDVAVQWHPCGKMHHMAATFQVGHPSWECT